MERFRDLTGRRFGKLQVLWPTGRKGVQKKICWLCQCDCGTIKNIQGRYLLRGTISCGCLQKEIHTKHGMTDSSEYRSWCHIKGRCYNPKDKKYYRYGGRGIKMCERWKNSFETFYEDMGPKPGKGCSINRINNNGNYEPGNCEWATAKEQANNRRTNRQITFNNKTQTLAQWAKEVNMSHSVIFHRLKLGWPIERALTTPVKERK